MPTTNTITREQWLQHAVTALTPFFSAKGYSVPNCHVSRGFASTDVKRGHIGQCWSTKASADKVNQIFISPALSERVQVLDTLLHELVHAVDDCQNKHGPVFKKMALKLGMKGPEFSGEVSQSPAGATFVFLLLKAQLLPKYAAQHLV
jgi:hypothetical protein